MIPMATQSSHHAPLPQLTAKQREVIALVADNRTSKEIARLLGISESAVNQRIEHIRTRLGGIPRGELARLYRQEFARNHLLSSTFPPNWQKIQVTDLPSDSHGEATESIPAASLTGSQAVSDQPGDGSQLSSQSFFPGGPKWLTRENSFTELLRAFAIMAIMLFGVVIAAEVTQFIS